MTAAYLRATVPPAKEAEPNSAGGIVTKVTITPVASGQFVIDVRQQYRLVDLETARLATGTAEPPPHPEPVVEEVDLSNVAQLKPWERR